EHKTKNQKPLLSVVHGFSLAQKVEIQRDIRFHPGNVVALVPAPLPVRRRGDGESTAPGADGIGVLGIGALLKIPSGGVEDLVVGAIDRRDHLFPATAARSLQVALTPTHPSFFLLAKKWAATPTLTT